VPDSSAAIAGAWAGDVSIGFRVAGTGDGEAGVRLLTDAPVDGRADFRRNGGRWELTLPRPPLARMEYLLELRYPDGTVKVTTDPANPLQAPGAFGPKSVLEFPGYRMPSWLSAPADAGGSRALELPVLDEVMLVRVWAPAGTRNSERLPLLVVHDGPEYDAFASVTRYLGAGIRSQWLPRLRAALLSPGPRNNWYSANARYARALREVVLPALDGRFGVSRRIGMGTSLGALAMLHAYCRSSGSFDALFLQSGSFFTPDLDSQERRFPNFRRIIGFTADVRGGGLPRRPVPITMTCGAIEENIGNNRLMTQVLRTHDYPAALDEMPDMHNYTAWRDAFEPSLTGLLQQAAA
jgi:enterochelin esterase-like enzyme